jgi:hypothetical protein
MKYLTVFLSAAMLFTTGAQAMDIIQFDQMTAQDRQAFLNFLPQAAEKVLEQEGRSADAQKVHHLFNDILPDGGIYCREGLTGANERSHANPVVATACPRRS